MSEEIDFRTLCENVARELGGKSSGRDENAGHYRDITMPSGRTLHLYKDTYRKRITIGASIAPRDEKDREISFYWRGDKRPEISVALTRTSKAIASEITRRFLPLAEPYFVAYDEARAAHDRYHDGQRSIADQLVGHGVASIQERDPRRSSNAELSMKLHLPEGVCGSIKVYSGSVNLELHSLSAEQAIAALKAIREA